MTVDLAVVHTGTAWLADQVMLGRIALRKGQMGVMPQMGVVVVAAVAQGRLDMPP
jgi:hypothetical protein